MGISRSNGKTLSHVLNRRGRHEARQKKSQAAMPGFLLASGP
jgi:hypothetical protein